MKKWLVAVFLAMVLVVGMVGWYLHNHTISVLSPKGPVGEHERLLLLVAVGLALAVLVPVYALAIGIVLKYRASNKKSAYTPDWDHHWGIEITRLIVLCSVIGLLAVVCIASSRVLDPQKPLQAQVKPITIQVVALQWKWLFIYPEQHIATVNFVEFPEKTPITFELTADAPMNSFWIPQLGGQMYAMSGMVNTLNLMADQIGEFDGSSAEISGAGFTDMRFKAKSVTANEFNRWVAGMRRSPEVLTKPVYATLAKPDTSTVPMIKMYSSVDARLYDTIVMKYMRPSATPTPSPMKGMPAMQDMPGM